MIVAGFGFRSATSTASLRAALELAQDGKPPVTHLATLKDKAETLAELARLLALPLVAITPDRLVGLQTLTHSLASRAARGTGSVAEACALAAAGGEGAHLLGTRHISPDRMATCAIAQGVSI